ncbi:MAG: tRNA (adenosine(37)-N6)-threonylcarbamoyltransferase complex dimerization subunit type 1 TsaB [Deltaproteobacteria bacterium]|nr:tRNA (adenosine(37)-N6)-threonylcarbamoyltransferase complex dimerization subunit type 1 TsaB [Deltaproteobacteria bacterium]
MIFAVNTTTDQFGLAIMDEKGLVRAEFLISSSEKNYTAFVPAVHSLLESSKMDVQDIQAIIVATGPGSFTGLRVGLSMTKGMAHGLGIPMIGVSSLEAMVHQVTYTALPICPLLTSRRGEVFFALFKMDPDREIHRLQEDRSIKLEDMASVIHEPTLFIGNDFSKQGEPVRGILQDVAVLAPAQLWNLKASSVGAAGLKRFLAQDFDDLWDLVPFYLHPPDIRPNPFVSLSES